MPLCQIPQDIEGANAAARVCGKEDPILDKENFHSDLEPRPRKKFMGQKPAFFRLSIVPYAPAFSTLRIEKQKEFGKQTSPQTRITGALCR